MDYLNILRKIMRYRHRYGTKRYYDKFYGEVIYNLGIKNIPVEGEEVWVKKWSNMKITPNPIYYRLFSKYIGNDARIVPEDICREIIEPCLNPEAFRKFYNDKNSWDLLYSPGIFPPTTVRCMDGMFYTADYKRLVDFNDQKLGDLLTDVGSGKYFVKPTRDSNSSQGTSSINFENEKWVLGKNSNSELTIKDIISIAGRNFIIQPFQKQHEYLANFCHTSVNPIRLITYKSVKDDQIHVLNGAMLRIGAEGEENDGTHGNGKFVGINPDGTMKHEVLDYRGNITYIFNGIDFRKDYKIPHYDKIKETAIMIASKVLHHRLLAFDIMLDEDGNPIVLEYNIASFSIWLSQFVREPAFDEYADEIIEYCRNNIDKIRMQFLY